MAEIVAIDGTSGTSKTAVATELAIRLGWRLIKAEEFPWPDLAARDQNDPQWLRASGMGRVIVEGCNLLNATRARARWKFFLDAEPRHGLQRRKGERPAELAPSRLPAGTILVDTSDYRPEEVAAMIASIVKSELAWTNS